MKRILIAEDNLPSRELVREILETEGYDVVEASDGRQALEMIFTAKPDLVVMDIQMPGLDGFKVVNEIRQIPQFAKIPIVALTAYAMAGDEERILAAGFDAYTTKPIDAVVLTRQIERQLSQPA